ncbi:hypothetical protein ACFL47_04015 [Candidatus Latescibacterota bacterium]
MLAFLLRFFLIWWIINIIFKWLGKPAAKQKESHQASNRHETDGATESQRDSDFVHSGRIEDADFEEIDDR